MITRGIRPVIVFDSQVLGQKVSIGWFIRSLLGVLSDLYYLGYQISIRWVISGYQPERFGPAVITAIDINQETSIDP